MTAINVQPGLVAPLYLVTAVGLLHACPLLLCRGSSRLPGPARLRSCRRRAVRCDFLDGSVLLAPDGGNAICAKKEANAFKGQYRSLRSAAVFSESAGCELPGGRVGLPVRSSLVSRRGLLGRVAAESDRPLTSLSGPLSAVPSDAVRLPCARSLCPLAALLREGVFSAGSGPRRPACPVAAFRL